jgi:DNA replication and repair protein RecF
MINGLFELRGSEEEIQCGQKRNQKKQFKRNKKEYQRLADHIGLFPLVMISPADSELITEGSESRRRFIDSVIAQFDRDYLDQLITYNKLLSQRNALLKQMGYSPKADPASLEVWDERMVPMAAQLHNKRLAFIEEFVPIFQKYYELISGGRELVGIAYNSHLSAGNFAATLTKALQRDLAMEYTTVGIHKDDLEFVINGYALKKYASQGQQKSFLIALKLAQVEYIRQVKSLAPILLLDDIYDKLDDSRVAQLMLLVSNSAFGQLFITDTHPDRLPKLFADTRMEVKTFSVRNGEVTEYSSAKNNHHEQA